MKPANPKFDAKIVSVKFDVGYQNIGPISFLCTHTGYA